MGVLLTTVYCPMSLLAPLSHSYASLGDQFSVPVLAEPAKAPQWITFNQSLAREIGLLKRNLEGEDYQALLPLFSGVSQLAGSDPVAQAYAGHQFGHFNPQLGDGRAILLGEMVDDGGQRWDVQFKGSGLTPFSRNGDGKAALGPVIRETIMSEAMHALGVKTTRALAAVLTGETIYRETALPGALLTRVASSHIRIGTFEFFARREQWANVKLLANYAIDRHFPHCTDADNPYLEFLKSASRAQAELVAHWASIGFVHGVMNTDNTSICGETIDYGPCAFLDAYIPDQVFSSIDTGGRYAFNRQQHIIVWNLARLAECLLPLIDENVENAVEVAKAELEGFSQSYDDCYLQLMSNKLGFCDHPKEKVAQSVEGFLPLLKKGAADFTLAFRLLGEGAVIGQFDSFLQLFSAEVTDAAQQWLDTWISELDLDAEDKGALSSVGVQMRNYNPAIIPRNSVMESTIGQVHTALAEGVDFEKAFEPVLRLQKILQDPFNTRHDGADYAQAPRDGGVEYRTFCGT